MFGITKLLASLSLKLRQPLESFCEIETTHGNALVTKKSDYVTFLRIDGLRRQPTRAEIERIANAQRLDLSGALENPGHAIVGFYISDPDLAAVEIERINMEGCRGVARELGLDLTDILAERSARWPKLMRWEAAYYVLWTRRGVLTKEERKQMKEEQDALARECPGIGSSQRYYLRSEVMAARHNAFVARVEASLHGNGIATTELKAHDALQVIRETLYRETAGSPWKATLQGDRVMPRLPEEGAASAKPENLLWPSIGSQIFHADAETHGGQRVRIGEYEYAHVDMRVGPEEPRPFIELAAPLGRDRLPWRATFVIEGGGKLAMS
ncbi:MAG: ATP-binding protein, partial [Methylobacterium sp.]